MLSSNLMRRSLLVPFILMLVGMLAAVIVVMDIQPASASHAGATADLVMLRPTLHGSGNGSSVEEQQAAASGLSFDLKTNAEWAAMTTADFAKYHAIVLGDPHCGGASAITTANATAGTWGPAITGDVIIIGTDPDWHGHGGANARRFVTKDGISFAAQKGIDDGKTGAYITLSCYYGGAGANTPVPMLDTAFGAAGDFKIRGAGCFNTAHIVATHPALSNVTDAILSGWSCSVHEAFDAWPVTFEVLAIGLGLGSVFTAPDGTVGTPYIIARGVTVISDITLSPDEDTNPLGTDHTVTALVEEDGSPVVGVDVTFEIVAGPNVGDGGVDTTDANGEATFTYTGDGGIGTDIIEATFIDSLGRTQRSNRVVKRWEKPKGPVCNGVPATIVGTDAGEFIWGTNGPDVIVGLGGDDTIEGLGGDDIICAGPGEDLVDGNGGNDLIFGEEGDDELWGDADDDTIWGGPGMDRILGNGGNDEIHGGPDMDDIDGNNGEDTIWGDGGDDWIAGGKHNDWISGGPGEDSLDGNGGDDTIYGGDDADEIYGGPGNDAIKADGGNDFVDGEKGDDTIAGGEDDDEIVGNRGNDTIYGGPGEDDISGSQGHDEIHGGDDNDYLDGGSGNDTIYGDDGDDFLGGYDGNDDLDGGDGADTITGNGGDDTLAGGLGGDGFVDDLDAGWQNTKDTCVDEAGTDTLSGCEVVV